jgi:HEPN domain-containing protein
VNSRRLAEDYLEQAKVRLEALDLFLDRQRYDAVIREAQAIVELVLKGLLRSLGVDPPRLHDVSDVLATCGPRLPQFLADELPVIAEMSAYLSGERSQAFYGDEAGSIPSSELYGRGEAERVRNWTCHLVSLYERALRGV